jgi:hypothetical protein
MDAFITVCRTLFCKNCFGRVLSYVTERAATSLGTCAAVETLRVQDVYSVKQTI